MVVQQVVNGDALHIPGVILPDFQFIFVDVPAHMCPLSARVEKLKETA